MMLSKGIYIWFKSTINDDKNIEKRDQQDWIVKECKFYVKDKIITEKSLTKENVSVKMFLYSPERKALYVI